MSGIQPQGPPSLALDCALSLCAMTMFHFETTSSNSLKEFFFWLGRASKSPYPLLLPSTPYSSSQGPVYPGLFILEFRDCIASSPARNNTATA